MAGGAPLHGGGCALARRGVRLGCAPTRRGVRPYTAGGAPLHGGGSDRVFPHGVFPHRVFPIIWVFPI